MTTNAYAAKRAIIDRLADEASRPGPLGDVQILYAYQGDLRPKCVYGTSVLFVQPEDESLQDGDGWAPQEVATITLVIRVRQDPAEDAGVRASDEACEAIGEAIGAIFRRYPRLAGGNSVTRLDSGQGDYVAEDTANVSQLIYRITVQSIVE